jgi:hypothetical protein
MVRKIVSTVLVVLVLFFTVISILAIWDLIPIEDIFSKTLKTLLVLFVSSAILLFIFAILFKSENEK